MKEADQVLVEKFNRTRDEATFKKLYRRHTPVLYLLALRLCGGSEANAQDAVQESWIRACRLLPKFEWRSSLRTWLTGILINCVREINHGPGKRQVPETPDELDHPAVAAEPGVRLDLERAIARLPTGYRHVLILHDVEGYTHEEISAQLEISVGTSKSQLFHARQALRKIFRFKVR